MPDNFENLNVSGEIAPWLNSAAFNNSYTYSFVSRSAFYGMINPEYHSFMSRFVQNWLWWYDGYVPYFHNAEQGIPSTRIAAALVNKIAKKVVGGRVMYKNAGKDKTCNTLNEARSFISTKWAKDTNFEAVVKKAARYAAC